MNNNIVSVTQRLIHNSVVRNNRHCACEVLAHCRHSRPVNYNYRNCRLTDDDPTVALACKVTELTGRTRPRSQVFICSVSRFSMIIKVSKAQPKDVVSWFSPQILWSQDKWNQGGSVSHGQARQSPGNQPLSAKPTTNKVPCRELIRAWGKSPELLAGLDLFDSLALTE